MLADVIKEYLPEIDEKFNNEDIGNEILNRFVSVLVNFLPLIELYLSRLELILLYVHNLLRSNL